MGAVFEGDLWVLEFPPAGGGMATNGTVRDFSRAPGRAKRERAGDHVITWVWAVPRGSFGGTAVTLMRQSE
jgi:hypothetical protein